MENILRKILVSLISVALITACNSFSVPQETVAVSPTPTFVPLSISPSGAVEIESQQVFGKGTISQIAWSPDGTFIAAAGSAGIYFYDAYYGCDVTINDNAITGDGTLSEYGIYAEYYEDGSTGSINNNTISGFIYDGIYVYEVYDGAQLTVDENTVTGTGAATTDTGIYIDDYVEYGSTISINNNTIADCYDGIYADDSWEYGGWGDPAARDCDVLRRGSRA